MNENNNTAGDLTTMVFSFLSLKTKLIIIGIIIVVFLIILLPVIILASVGGINSDEDESASTTTSATSEVTTSDTLYQYMNATFPMPFETWNSGKDVVTSKFSNNRTITVNGVTTTKAHTGIDLVVISKSDPKICAVKEGTVVVAKAGTTGYGNYVVIQHQIENITFYTLYGHMKEGSIMVAEGNKVEEGQILGTMGSTGNSTGNHLHFEVRIGQNASSSAVDPYTYLFGN